MSDNLIAVTGATGEVGSRVASRLARAGVAPRLVVRDPARAPQLPGAQTRTASYDDPVSMREALSGVDTMLLISASEHPDRVGLHRGAVDAAAAAGVGRIVYTSFLGAAPEATFTFARDHWHTEQYIRGTRLGFTFLRDSLYQDVLPFFASLGSRDAAAGRPGGEAVIAGPAGDGRFAPVARDDVADVAVAALRDPVHTGQTYDLTGPQLITMAQVAEEIGRAAGRPVRYHAETIEQAYASRSHYGAPEWEMAGWVSSYAAIATGELELVSDAVTSVTGHPPLSFRQWLAANPDSLRRLRGTAGG